MVYISVLQRHLRFEEQIVSDGTDLASGTEDTVQNRASLDIMRSKIQLIMNCFIVIIFLRHKLNPILAVNLIKL